MIEGSLGVKLPTIRTDETQRWEELERKVRRESQRREEKKEEDQRRESQRKSEERRCRCAKPRKVGKHGVFPMVCGAGGSKSRLAKAAGAEPSGQMRDKELHDVAARSTVGSEKRQSTPG